MNCPCCNRTLIYKSPYMYESGVSVIGHFQCPVGGWVSGMYFSDLSGHIYYNNIDTQGRAYITAPSSMRCYPPDVFWVSNEKSK